MGKTVIYYEVCRNSTKIIEGQPVFVCPDCGGVFQLNKKQEKENERR